MRNGFRNTTLQMDKGDELLGYKLVTNYSVRALVEMFFKDTNYNLDTEFEILLEWCVLKGYVIRVPKSESDPQLGL